MNPRKMFIIRKHRFDMGHRVMHEGVKCWSPHGHDYHIEVKLSFSEMHSIGYAVDFKEIKRVFMSYIDHRFDHGTALNPQDTILIEALQQIKNKATGECAKMHIMNLMGPDGDCNPSAENLAKELFYAAKKLLDDPNNCSLKVEQVTLWETPNCYVECTDESLSVQDVENLEASEFARELEGWRKSKGTIQYDTRKAQESDINHYGEIDN